MTVHPHAWGDNGGRIHAKGYAVRFTPTRVGTTSRTAGKVYAPLVHPHACGDNWVMSQSDRVESGSPPRVWGQHNLVVTPALPGRFTPTRVGTTCHGPGCKGARSVHPHACGDNGKRRGKGDGSVGSPPRVWGQPIDRSALPRLSRFTPTRVGTTCSFRFRIGANPVHPHACGDNACQADERGGGNGSPPRVWGQPAHAQATLATQRFTPTRVGTTG